MSFVRNVKKVFLYRAGYQPSIRLAHRDPARSAYNVDVYALTAITVPRPPSGTIRAHVPCSLCRQAVPMDITDAPGTQRGVLVWRILAAIIGVLFVAFSAYMVVGTFTAPEAERPPEILWLIGYAPLLIALLFVTSRFETADGVVLLERENHQLRNSD
ncbi:hypothetical protein [Nocardia salmonicida]|uniref:hypothetical protein n=2 Tax=Nocardia salmonicida TaxID=53431 RepID=UPI00379FE1C7